MSDLFKRIWNTIAPIVGMIIFIALFILGLFVFSYLLVIAAIIGLGLFIYAFIRSKLSHHRNTKKTYSQSEGRIIEHDNTHEEKNSSNDANSNDEEK